MKNYKIIIQYDGTRYSGWQKQGNTNNTIQGKIENVLNHMINDKYKKASGKVSEIEIHGSGRTDAGVHAFAQAANFKSDIDATPDKILDYMNEYLPLDIRVTSVTEVSLRFHARLNASKKHYRYTIDNGSVADVFNRKYMTRLKDNYDINAMRKAANLLIGEHDFKSFCDNKRMKKSTIRTIYDIEIAEDDGIITLDFYGNGFLYHMVRILTGTLIEIGTGKREFSDISRIIEAKSRTEAGFTAPPQGLMLMEVFFL